ncbi:hypothetical protein [Sphaerisporangium perillae]|uniref:hypothetical protein n=1 Tax=Sphaerisporangium perillae TaxID=2935860 RepID=UPI00200FF431|nr:hypothetical protein [Sphaerisporangium perillae]
MIPRVAALLGAAVTLCALAGCAGAQAAAGGPATVEEIAAKTGCAAPQMQVDAEELRQGVCKTSKGQYSVTTFATEKGKQEWLDDALSYGGAYLVGTRWIVLGNTTEMLEPFRATLGGTVRKGGHTMPSGQPMPQEHTMAPGEPMPEGHTMPSGQPMPDGHSMPPGEHTMPMP